MKTNILLFTIVALSLAQAQAAPPPQSSVSPQPAISATASPSPSIAPGTSLPAKNPQPSLGAAWTKEALNLRGAEVVSPNGSVGHLSRINHDLVIHGPFQGDVSIIHGDLYILGTVTGSVSVVGGQATIIGTVDGPVSVTGGDLRLSGTVRGATSVVGGQIIQDRNSRILGATSTVGGSGVAYTRFPFGLWKRHHSDDWGAFLLSPLWVAWDALFLVLWLVVAVAIAAIWPTHVASAAGDLPSQGVRYGAAGFLFWIAFWFLAICSALLSMFLIGIPFAMLLFVLYVVVKWYGYTIVFAGIGRWILRPGPGCERSVITCTAVGALAAGLFRFLPIVGFIGWQVLGWVAAGAAVIKVSAALAKRSAPMPPVQAGPLSPPPAD
jgi:hypothetical protein